MDEIEKLAEKILSEHPKRALTPKKYKCPKCKDKGFLERIDEHGYTFWRDCECTIIQKAKEMMERSGISAEFQKKSFVNFDTRGEAQLSNAKVKAVEYVKSFEKTEHDRRNSIMFTGQVGAGKTHLGTAICSELMNAGIAVIYMAYRNAITKIKQNLIDEEVYHREMEKYTSARVLYIDDLLKGRLTDSDVNIMYEIVNYRYMNNMPIIISTEKSIDDLLEFDEAIGSRLIEMCRGNIVQLQGKNLNYRMFGR